METKEEIAKIIKHCKEEHNLIPYKTFINHLANYFEKEAKKKVAQYKTLTETGKNNLLERIFNRKQFLKDCGR